MISNRSCKRVWAVAAVFALAPFANATAQSVSGQVTEKSTGTPVRNANLVLLDQGGHPKAATVSDTAGWYVLRAAAPGTYRLTVSGPGLNPIQTQDIQLFADKQTNFDIVLSLGTPRLATVVVKGEKSVVNASAANPHKYDEFLMRRKLGIGTFLTREQIEAKPTAQTPSIFAQIPGLKVRQHGTSWDIRSQRCPAKLPGGGPGSEDMLADDPTQWPILYIDGVHVRGLATLNDINPSQIEGIEVYQGAAQLPAIAKGNACAAIFVWLKSGQ